MSGLARGAALFAMRHGPREERADAAKEFGQQSALSPVWQSAVDRAKTRFANDPAGLQRWLETATDPNEEIPR